MTIIKPPASEIIIEKPPRLNLLIAVNLVVRPVLQERVGRPFGIAFYGEASNSYELLRPKAAVVDVMVKRHGGGRIMQG